ncbi:hypothetical protein [Achromobacter ruhlandii]|uniref:hypothetical protein n=1 Tax=Achromobacter ruhlandii TaxID=72557 RepID=UPI003B9CE6CF
MVVLFAPEHLHKSSRQHRLWHRAKPQNGAFDAGIVVMHSFGAGAARMRPTVGRRRAIAWWAAGLSCALHVALAWLAWRAPAPQGPPPLAPRDALFVDLLSPSLASAPARSSAPASSSAGPGLSAPPAARASPALPMSAPPAAAPVVPSSGAARSAGPRARPGATSTPAAPPRPTAAMPAITPGSSATLPSAPSAAPARDFRWRAEDAAAQGAPHARGEPRVNLAPKAAAEPSALARGIAQSARPPCREAHAHMGLLAAPLLLVDALRGDGCKW